MTKSKNKEARKVSTKHGLPASQNATSKEHDRSAGKKLTAKKSTRKAVGKAAWKEEARKIRHNPLKAALKAHSQALQVVNTIQKKLDKAKEEQKKALARIEAIKAKEAAAEAKAVAKTEKLSAAKAKKVADKEAKTIAKKGKTKKAAETEITTELTVLDIV